jgi:5-methylcytosine-specific restriction endonuclease McrA
MNLKTLSNDGLESRLSKLVKTERKITHLVLQCIAEIDQRKLFLDNPYPSLFEYLVREHGYSPSAAMRRIDGARLLRQLPEVAEKIESGSINLSQVSLIQRAEREVRRESKMVIPVHTKRELLTKIEHQTQAKSEQVIAETLNIQFSPANKIIQHRNDSVTVTMTFTAEQIKVLESVQAILSHAVPEKNWAILVTYLAQKELSRRTQSQVSTAATALVASSEPDVRSDVCRSRQQIKSNFARRPIPSLTRKQLLHADAFCAYRNPLTGKICGSRHFLQIDHFKAVIRGGGNEIENLQVLCGQHNRQKFALESHRL